MPLPVLSARSAAAAIVLLSSITACGGSGPSAVEPAKDGEPSDDGGPPGPSPGRDGGAPAPSEGCKAPGAGAAPGLQTKLSIDVAGTARSYDVSIPSGHGGARSYPLVFVFHGGGGSSEGARKTFGFEAIAGDDAVFVYPQGLGNWDLDSPADTNRDVAFFDAVLAKLRSELCVDGARVFATGSSRGGYFANQLGCRRGDELRAIAPHAGGGPYEINGTYDAAGRLVCLGAPPAVMVVHGEKDTSVPISEAEKSLTHWRWALGCTSDTEPYAPDPCAAYQGCAKPVVRCRVPGQGHDVWTHGPRATWDFFASF